MHLKCTFRLTNHKKNDNFIAISSAPVGTRSSRLDLCVAMGFRTTSSHMFAGEAELTSHNWTWIFAWFDRSRAVQTVVFGRLLKNLHTWHSGRQPACLCTLSKWLFVPFKFKWCNNLVYAWSILPPKCTCGDGYTEQRRSQKQQINLFGNCMHTALAKDRHSYKRTHVRQVHMCELTSENGLCWCHCCCYYRCCCCCR